MSIIDTLNHNEGAVVGLATVALVLVTAVYVWLTHRVLRETQRATLGAEIVLRELNAYKYEPEGGFIRVPLVSVGHAPPTDVEVTLTLAGQRLERQGNTSVHLPGAVQVRSQVESAGPRRTLYDKPPGLETVVAFVVPPDLAQPGDWGEAIARCTWSDRMGTYHVERRQLLTGVS